MTLRVLERSYPIAAAVAEGVIVIAFKDVGRQVTGKPWHGAMLPSGLGME
jgi:hypothetical protein